MREGIKISKMDTFTKVLGLKIYSMEKERSFIKEMETFLKVNLCMEVNLVKENTHLLMEEFMKVTFTTAIAMGWGNY